ncbi:MAG: Hsp20/alpha crystallin family protein [bacterium]
MSEDTPKPGTRRLLTVVVVLLCLVALFQAGLLLQRHLARPGSPVVKSPPSEIAWNPDDEIASMHAQINQMFNQAFSAFSSHPPAAAPSPGASDGSADPSPGNPFAPMRHMQRQIDALFAGALNTRDLRRTRFDEGWTRLEITPGFNVRDTGEAYEITVQLPGVDKSDIHIQMEHSILALVVEQNLRQSAVNRNGATVQQTSQTSRFERHLRLPGATDNPETIKATYADDSLHIIVPKASQTNSPTRPIPIQ